VVSRSRICTLASAWVVRAVVRAQTV